MFNNVWETWGVCSEEENDKKIIKILAPQLKKEDIKVEVLKNHLEVSAEKEGDFLTSFSHLIHIGDYDPSTIEASLEEGVLTIKIEKKEEAKPRSIKIKG